MGPNGWPRVLYKVVGSVPAMARGWGQGCLVCSGDESWEDPGALVLCLLLGTLRR